MTGKVADVGKDIILIMHSYSGIPETKSAHGVTKKEWEALGKKGGVAALLYVTAFLVGPGKSLGSTMGEVSEFQIMSKSRYAVHWLPFST